MSRFERFMLRVVRRNSDRHDEKLNKRYERTVRRATRKHIRETRRKLAKAKIGTEVLVVVNHDDGWKWHDRGFTEINKDIASRVASYYNEMEFGSKHTDSHFSGQLVFTKMVEEGK